MREQHDEGQLQSTSQDRAKRLVGRVVLGVNVHIARRLAQGFRLLGEDGGSIGFAEKKQSQQLDDYVENGCCPEDPVAIDE